MPLPLHAENHNDRFSRTSISPNAHQRQDPKLFSLLTLYRSNRVYLIASAAITVWEIIVEVLKVHTTQYQGYEAQNQACTV